VWRRRQENPLMVAYSFKATFRAPIITGTKRQTIRADRKRHARPGEQLQLYTGMRTRHCRIIGRAECKRVEPVRIGVADNWLEVGGQPRLTDFYFLDAFARDDGFAGGWGHMMEFWRREHPNAPVFSGVLIQWAGFMPGEALGRPNDG
jgi:hypothetical protein